MSWNIQEQEDRDYQMGSASELQNAFAWSSMNRKPNDPRINEELAQGRFVVVSECAQYCPSTDACMGTRKIMISSHTTREEAEAVLAQEEGDDEVYVYILPRPPAPPAPPSDPDEIPF